MYFIGALNNYSYFQGGLSFLMIFNWDQVKSQGRLLDFPLS